MSLAYLALIADTLGTFLFALQGALIAVDMRLDFVGLMVFAFSTALAGGIIRDLLIGSVPPRALKIWWIPLIPFLASCVTFFYYQELKSVSPLTFVSLDAAALAVFAVSGTTKALSFKLPAVSATLMGVITGSGGGVVRDMLMNNVPRILNSEVYASSAFLASLIIVVGVKLKFSPIACSLIGGGVCILVRVLTYMYNIQIPRPL